MDEPVPKIGGSKTISDLKGDVRFNDVTFSYPSRPEDKILDKVSFHIPSDRHVFNIYHSHMLE